LSKLSEHFLLRVYPAVVVGSVLQVLEGKAS